MITSSVKRIETWALPASVGLIALVVATAPACRDDAAGPSALEHTRHEVQPQADAAAVPPISTSPQLATFALYAMQVLTLGQDDQIGHGDIGVSTLGAAGPQAQLRVAAFSRVDGNVLAPSVALGRGSHVGNVQTTTLENEGGTLASLAAFPSTMPLRRPVEINDSEVAFLPVVLASRNPTTER
jgi:hypothetical protein